MTETTPTTRHAAVEQAAERLRQAAETGVPSEPVRDLIGSKDVELAYAVQQLNVAARLAEGGVVVGRKIGLTSAAVQAQLGVDQPDFGTLLDDMALANGAVVPHGAVLQPRVEAEIAFVLKEDLDEGPLDHEQVLAAIDYAVAAIEVCGSRVAGWDITFADTVSDNASGGMYVLGSRRQPLTDFTPRNVTMSMTVDGEEVSTGSGAACMGDPVAAVVWLARTARALGEPLLSGQVILSGALGPMWPVGPGAEVGVTISGLGTVSAVFGEEGAR